MSFPAQIQPSLQMIIYFVNVEEFYSSSSLQQFHLENFPVSVLLLVTKWIRVSQQFSFDV